MRFFAPISMPERDLIQRGPATNFVVRCQYFWAADFLRHCTVMFL